MDISNLTPEQIEKAKACRNSNELFELAREEGIELNDEQLNAVSGGVSAWEDINGCDCYTYAKMPWE